MSRSFPEIRIEAAAEMLTNLDLERNLNRVHEWIKAADQKVSIFLAFQGVVLTILFPNVFSWATQHLKDLKPANQVVFFLGIALAGYSLYKSASAIIPRLTRESSKKSITFFGDIAKFDLKDYTKAIRETNDEEYGKELVEQIYASSRIAARKHFAFRGAILTFLSGMILLATSFLLFALGVGR